MDTKMKNFFEYAKNELAQDAFLMWLFDNYEDKELNALVRDLLENFCGISKHEKIKGIKSHSQFKKIDIKIAIDMEDIDKNQVLYIEDKVFSDVGESQLVKYNDIIDKDEIQRKKNKLFYKTSLISPQDKIELDKETNKVNGWKHKNINDIYSLFSPYQNTNNLILSQYIEHIAKIYNYANTEERPKEHSDKYDFLAWLSFFNKVFEKWDSQTLNKFNGEVRLCGSGYHYVYLKLQNDVSQPAIEIRSSQCLNNTFTARLLFYGVEKEIGGKKSDEEIRFAQKEMLEILNTTGFVKGTGDFNKPRNGRFKRELALYKAEKVETIDDFVKHIEICAVQFNKFLKIWENN